jgi:hypothetical protein
METLHNYISHLASDEERASSMDIDVDVEREIIRLRGPLITLDVNGDGVLDGHLTPTLDADSAAFSGIPLVTFSLANSTGPSASGFVQDDLAIEGDGE